MTLTRFSFTERVRPVLEVGIGSSVYDAGVALWDQAVWDVSTWSGDEPLWRDVSCDIIDALTEQGRERVMDPFPVGTATITADNRTGWADPSTDFEIDDSVGYLSFPGEADNYITIEDYAALGITGDMGVVFRFRTPEWPATPYNGVLAIIPGQWLVMLQSNNCLQFWFVQAGVIKVIQSPPIVPSDEWRWYAIMFDANNGASGHSWKWWYGGSDDTAAVWQEFATGTTAGVATIDDAHQPLYIGSTSASGFTGDISHLSVRNGTGASLAVGGTPVFTMDGWQLDGTETIRHYGAVDFPGTVANYLSTPSTTEVRIAGDITIVARIAPDDWSPTGTGAIVSLGEETSNLGYRFSLTTAGQLILAWTADGITPQTKNSSVNLAALPDGTELWVSATLDVDDGAGGHDVRFFTSDDGIVWTQLGTTQHSGGTTSIFPSTTVVEISGNNNGAARPFKGLIKYVSIRNGIGAAGVPGGTEVFRFDANADLDGVSSAATSFLSGYGFTMTVHRSGSPSTILSSTYLPTITPTVGPNPMRLHRAGVDQLEVVPVVRVDSTHLQLRPGRALRVGVNHETLGTRWLWRGFIDAIEPRDHPEDWSTVVLRCIDALGEVGRAKLYATEETGYGEQAHARFGRILNLASWASTKRFVHTSAIRELYAAKMDGQVVDLLRQTAESEGGWCWGDNNGNVVLQPRSWLLTESDAEPDATIGNVDVIGGLLFMQDPPGSGIVMYLGDLADWEEDPVGSGLYEWVGD